MAHFALISINDTICKGVNYLSAYLKTHGHDVTRIYFKKSKQKKTFKSNSNSKHYNIYHNGFLTVSGYEADQYTKKEKKLLIELLAEIKPDVVGFSSRVCYLDLSCEVVPEIKIANPDIITIAGGYGPTYLPEKFAQAFDYICYGEGEKFIEEVGQHIDSGTKEKIVEIAGVGYLNEDKKFILSCPAEPVYNLDQLPFPDLPGKTDFLIDENKIQQTIHLDRGATLELSASRGCPANCTFCSAGQWHNIYKNYAEFPKPVPKVRTRSPANVIDEIISYTKKYQEISDTPIGRIAFMDSIFGINKRWLSEFCDIYKNKVGLPLQVNTDIRFHTREMLEELYAAGLVYTTFSLQSGSEMIREKIFNRKISNQKLIETANFFHAKASLNCQVDLLGFNPFDTVETLKETFSVICQIPPVSALTVFRLIIQPETNLDRLYKEHPPSNELTDKEHETWIFLWFLASRGGREREISQEIVNASAGSTPIDLHKELQKIYNGERDVAFTLENKCGTCKDIDLAWPYTLNFNTAEHHWQTVSRQEKKEITIGFTDYPHQYSKYFIGVEDDFVILNEESTSFVYLGYVNSKDSTCGHNLAGSVLTFKQFSGFLDAKGGVVKIFIQHSPSKTIWVGRDIIPRGNEAIESYRISLDDSEERWDRLCGQGSLESVLAGKYGSFGYDCFGFMVIEPRECPTGAWGLTYLSISPNS